MPKTKHSKPSDSSDSDSGPEDRTPVKKTKKGSGDDDRMEWDLGKSRAVRLTEFKGKWYVDIREFYNSDGEMKPGRKGIMLTMEQYQKMKGVIEEVDAAIKRHI